eukprot:5852283-Pleurochrysis_carterae.AAC.1
MCLGGRELPTYSYITTLSASHCTAVRIADYTWMRASTDTRAIGPLQAKYPTIPMHTQTSARITWDISFYARIFLICIPSTMIQRSPEGMPTKRN